MGVKDLLPGAAPARTEVDLGKLIKVGAMAVVAVDMSL